LIRFDSVHAELSESSNVSMKLNERLITFVNSGNAAVDVIGGVSVSFDESVNVRV
jgi:hypothetical protein